LDNLKQAQPKGNRDVVRKKIDGENERGAMPLGNKGT
jgi:hypothetical protein